ncbi:dihydrolipoyllysine-residue acetyltransferase [Alteromonas sediminis]|uniref:Dihydrolipoamide acetyltransferase component of pyruvate dehydrogenase complex n=1 Tax=Alteromonas sediminis TaxID=2259342 RepID=A0A3N5Y0T1_9ALTE|nr:dihydrolipoyllysine-residue acetyltransferase [Alteromonas sediminis]RPJ67327.1 dihydrolipoyllysine-residue acetyltransferase [Alteromonas sediminis]
MQTEFILPDIGEGIVECELLEWLVKEGDTIVEDQPVAEVMTDKATVQIPAMHAGVVVKLHYKEGDIAKVHAPLFAMSVDSSDTATTTEETSSKPHEVQQEDKNEEVTSSAGHEDFLLPDIGEGIVECEIVKWHVAQGDKVEEDQPVVEVMTDKAVVEIPAKHAGMIVKLYHQEGEIAKVHAPLFAISGGQDEGANPAAKPSQDSQGTARTPASGNAFTDGAFEPPVAIPGKVLASPAVRRLAREQQIDLSTIEGSGKKGRILKVDVLSQSHSIDQQPRTERDNSSVSDSETKGATRTEKVRGIQAAMAKQMAASVYTIPHFSVSDELDMDGLIALRKKLKPEFEKQGVKLSFLPFFIKAMSLALKEFPIINAQLNDDATELTYFDDHNIGVAVDSKVGLLVPNIKQVQNLSLLGVAKALQSLIELGREGRLGGEALKGGTISISNIGALGGITATPVINKPEAAIVALGKTQQLPRFDAEGNVYAANIMTVNWSGDHRIIDGATMVKFNNTWCDYLRDPSSMLMHLV